MLQRVKLSVKNILKRNSGKIVIATVICALLIGFWITSMNSNATTKEVVTPTTKVYVRENYNIENSVPVGTIITSFGPETQLDYLDTVTDSRGKQWYKVSFPFGGITRTGYVSAGYSIKSIIEVTVPVPVPAPGEPAYANDAAFEEAMTAQGFPESYKVKLREVRKACPYISFEAFQTGLTWNEVLAAETSYASISLVGKNNPTSWKSLINGAYDWRTGTWNQYEPGWVSASPALVAYYLDPRNFLNLDDGSILQFHKLSYSASENLAGVQAIMGNYANTAQGQSIQQTFLDVGKANDVSAYHLASRAMQETGYGSTGSAKGTYPGFENLYNFFNISAYLGAFKDHPELDTPVKNALMRARIEKWTTPSLSIAGGAPTIAENFIKKKQDTLYFQKFDVVGVSGNYNHQYMTNIQAAWAEGRRLIKSFPDLSTTYMTLKIPVYSNMPESNPKPTDNRNPNNRLTSLGIYGVGLTPAFDMETTKYSVAVADSTQSLSLFGTTASPDASVAGLGTVNLNPTGNTSINISVTPPYGDVRTYTIDVIKSPQVPVVPTVKPGDFNRNGKIDLVDIVKLKNYYVGKLSLQGEDVAIADINRDGKFNLVDIVKAKRIFVGLE